MLAPETIVANFDRLRDLCGPANLKDRSGPFIAMLDHLGERLALCPASAKVEYHNCFPGGLVEHSLRVLDFASEWHKGLKRTLSGKIRRDSLIIACIGHDLGKVGDHEQAYYIPLARENEWKREKWGQHYDYNDQLTYMTVPFRALWLLQHFGVRLTQDEALAIHLSDGQYVPDNKSYALKEPDLALIVHQADILATRWEKEHQTAESRLEKT